MFYSSGAYSSRAFKTNCSLRYYKGKFLLEIKFKFKTKDNEKTIKNSSP